MELAIAAIFQNEAPFLKEWIDFHLLMGAEFFYLFDHLSVDAPEKVLQPYVDKGVVKLVPWPMDYSNVREWTEWQCLAYERALHWARGRTKWLAILDVDEFLFAPQGNLLETVNEYAEFGGVAVNWQVFGTSGVAQVPEGKRLIETLNFKAVTDQETNLHVKSIVRPERVKGCENPHSMIYLPGYFQVDTEKNRFEGALSPQVRIDRLRINHYTLRDEQYLRTRKLPRLQKWWPDSLAEWERKHAAMNQVEDRAIHDFL